ncbi:UDP-glucose:glycoprotein glucosyltransferase-domain-containing protein [Mycena sanguinolenta]|nr:UDP-glucose:glycoprotein glucosyltransferase-domain-containing protein [Mycena sanguinolenta]
MPSRLQQRWSNFFTVSSDGQIETRPSITQPVGRARDTDCAGELGWASMGASWASTVHRISMVSSVLVALYVPEANEGDIFDGPSVPGTTRLEDQYSLVFLLLVLPVLTLSPSTFQFGDNSTALYHVAVILDPVSEIGQRPWSSLLQWLSHIPDMYIKVYMNPTAHEEIPLKRFYRTEIPMQAIFDGLSIEPNYTLGMDVPPSWLVQPREALYDLDNIQLGNLAPQDTSVDGVFGLDHIVVDGRARDSLTNARRVGSCYCGEPAVPPVQGEARGIPARDSGGPGSVGNEGLESRTVAEVGNEITVTSFEGLTIYPRLSRVPGMEHEDSLFFKDTPPAPVAPVFDQAEINIFTVAFTLLYERFVLIMILSVLRNTKGTIKCWFIENFLSPSFLPPEGEAEDHLILFLDVLFSMDLKKVIFVDADQIVRADLKGLIDLDIEGDNDLLRGSYQQLSADPASLANLGQDLPNSLQREIPIFSLHEDWLRRKTAHGGCRCTRFGGAGTQPDISEPPFREDADAPPAQEEAPRDELYLIVALSLVLHLTVVITEC